MMLTAAPVAGFLALEALVWSQARNAEGEKDTLSLLQAYAQASSSAGTLIVPEERVELYYSLWFPRDLFTLIALQAGAGRTGFGEPLIGGFLALCSGSWSKRTTLRSDLCT